MPHLKTWRELPLGIREHLIERMRDRSLRIPEAVELAQGLTRKIIESCLEHGDPLPPALARLRKPPLDLLIPVSVR